MKNMIEERYNVTVSVSSKPTNFINNQLNMVAHNLKMQLFLES